MRTSEDVRPFREGCCDAEVDDAVGNFVYGETCAGLPLHY